MPPTRARKTAKKTPTGAETRLERKAATRARILEVARAQLEREGYEATNLRSIAAEAGVVAGTVLLHFQDKQDLLHAALFDDLAATWARSKRACEVARGRPLEEELLEIAKRFFHYYAARPAVSRALLRESLFAAPPWSARFAAQVADVHAHVAALAVAAKARGELAEDVDPALFGAAFFSFYYFALLGWLQGGLPDPARLFQKLLRQHIEGLEAEGRAPARSPA